MTYYYATLLWCLRKMINIVTEYIDVHGPKN